MIGKPLYFNKYFCGGGGTLLARTHANIRQKAGMASAAVQKAAETIILKRMGRPEEVADAVVFLSSDAAS